MKYRKNLRWWLILIAIVYVLFPRDLIPDFMGRGLGLVDDAVIVGLLFRYYRKHQREHPIGREGSSLGADAEISLDPYEILGIPATASADEIQAAYRERMQEYHPDKVSHLGEDLQKLAHRKAQEIQWANQRLRNRP